MTTACDCAHQAVGQAERVKDRAGNFRYHDERVSSSHTCDTLQLSEALADDVEELAQTSRTEAGSQCLEVVELDRNHSDGSAASAPCPLDALVDELFDLILIVGRADSRLRPSG